MNFQFTSEGGGLLWVRGHHREVLRGRHRAATSGDRFHLGEVLRGRHRAGAFKFPGPSHPCEGAASAVRSIACRALPNGSSMCSYQCDN